MEFVAKLFWRLIPFAAAWYLYHDADGRARAYFNAARDIQELFDTYKDLQGAASVTAIYYKANQTLPADFKAFLKEMRPPKSGRQHERWQDGWGTTYVLRDYGDAYAVMSCGPDRDCAREGDNLVERIRKVAGLPGAGKIQIPNEKDYEKLLEQGR